MAILTETEYAILSTINQRDSSVKVLTVQEYYDIMGLDDGPRGAKQYTPGTHLLCRDMGYIQGQGRYISVLYALTEPTRPNYTCPTGGGKGVPRRLDTRDAGYLYDNDTWRKYGRPLSKGDGATKRAADALVAEMSEHEAKTKQKIDAEHYENHTGPMSDKVKTLMRRHRRAFVPKKFEQINGTTR